MYTYNAQIVDVYDGDTVTAIVDLGFHVQIEIKLRLLGINTPEINSTDSAKAKMARDYLRKLTLNQKVEIQTFKDKAEKYGRYLAIIYIKDQYGNKENVNQMMLNSGYAKEYL